MTEQERQQDLQKIVSLTASVRPSTDRLILRPFRPEDEADALSFLQDAEADELMGCPELEEERKAREKFHEFLGDQASSFAIEEKMSARVIGYFHFCQYPCEQEKPELSEKHGVGISFCLHRAYRHQQYMTELLETMLRFLFTEGALDFVVSGYFVFNTASCVFHYEMGFDYLDTHIVERGGKKIPAIDNVMYQDDYFRLRDGRAFHLPGGRELTLTVIGDSFSDYDAHPYTSCHRLHKGYIHRVLDRMPYLKVQNVGSGGATSRNWLDWDFPRGDLYLFQIGSNDWYHEVPLGTSEDFDDRNTETSLGCIANMFDRIREKSPDAPIIFFGPVERGEFVCLGDQANTAYDSTNPSGGWMLSETAEAMHQNALRYGVYSINMHDASGFTPEYAVRYKKVRTPEGYKNLPYPEYKNYPFDPEKDEFPYPLGSGLLTMDGLHPSDHGSVIIGSILEAKLKEVLDKEFGF